MHISGFGRTEPMIGVKGEGRADPAEAQLKLLEQERERRKQQAAETKDPQKTNRIEREIQTIEAQIARQAKAASDADAPKPASRLLRADAFVRSNDLRETGAGLYRVAPDENGDLKIQGDGRALKELRELDGFKALGRMDAPNVAKEPQRSEPDRLNRPNNAIAASQEDLRKQAPEKNRRPEDAAEKGEDDKKASDPDAGWSWAITRVEQDPDDPENRLKARSYVVAQGMGRTRGVDAM